MSSPSPLVLAWILAGVIAPAPDRVPPPDAREEAAAAFAEGTAAFERGDPTAALAAFERAHALSPHPKALSNIALCLAELGRHREAIVALESAIADERLTDDERALAADHLARSKAALATLRVTADAAVRVDVDADAHCTAPCSLELDPGPHDVVAPGWATRLQLAPGSITAVHVPSADVEPPRATPVERPAPPPRPARFGALGWVGVGVAALGGAGTLGFGLGARSLHADYVASPSDDERRRGITMRNLTNASIAVAAAGGVLLVTELIRWGVARRRVRAHATTVGR